MGVAFAAVHSCFIVMKKRGCLFRGEPSVILWYCRKRYVVLVADSYWFFSDEKRIVVLAATLSRFYGVEEKMVSFSRTSATTRTPKKESAHRISAVGGIISTSHLRQQSGRDSDHGSKSSVNSRFVSSICSGIFSSRYFRYS